MEDKFRANEEDENGRHEFLRTNKVIIDGQEVSLYDLAKQINKMTGNSISVIISIAQVFNSLKEKGLKLMGQVKRIKEERGYFIPSDLKEIDGLALEIINHVLSH